MITAESASLTPIWPAAVVHAHGFPSDKTERSERTFAANRAREIWGMFSQCHEAPKKPPAPVTAIHLEPRSTDFAWDDGDLIRDQDFTTIESLNQLLNNLDRTPAAQTEALVAYEWVKDAIGLSDRDLTPIVGLSKSTLYYWKREGGEPRATTVARLFQIHSLIQELAVAMEHRELVTWLTEGTHPRIDLLRSDALAAFQSEVDRVVNPNTGTNSEAMWEDEDLTLPQPAASGGPTIAKRSARRGSIS